MENEIIFGFVRLGLQELRKAVMAVTLSRVSTVQARQNVKYIGRPVTVSVFIFNLPVWRLWLGFKACKTEASPLAEWCSGKLLPEVQSLLLVWCGLVFRQSHFCTTCRGNVSLLSVFNRLGTELLNLLFGGREDDSGFFGFFFCSSQFSCSSKAAPC